MAAVLALTYLGLTVSTWITIASIAYQITQARKMKKAAQAAAEARKGYELVVEGEGVTLPIVYGRAKVGGVRSYHNTATNFVYATPNSDKTFGNVEFNNSINGKANEFLFFQQAICQGPINNVYDVVFDESRYLDDGDLNSTSSYTYDNTQYGESGQGIPQPITVTSLKSGSRIDLHYGDIPTADSIMAANNPERVNSVFTQVKNQKGLAYASVVIKLDRDEPAFSNVPTLQFFIEGKKIRDIIRSGSEGNYTYSVSQNLQYSNNSALCLLDYLLDDTSGKGMDSSLIDLESFYNAKLICDHTVLHNATVGGKVYFPTLGGTGAENITTSSTTRDIKLYECNAIIDTQKPLRENVESILSTMGDARLVWSAGKYKLNLQYPFSNSEIELAADLTDNDLVLDNTVTINWPTSSERLNQCIVRFHNESENFKEDTVSWPPKVSGTTLKGVGGFKYPVPEGNGWNDSTGGQLLKKYAVWSGPGSSFDQTWKFFVKESGSFNIEYTGDNYITINITDINGNSLFFGSHDTWNTTNIGSANLNANTEYRIRIQGTDDASGDKGVAVKISKGNLVYWTTRSDNFNSIITVVNDASVYENMKLEDNGLELETDVFADGITDYYHALAKAEELVRVSRSAFGIQFKYVIKDKFLEPGDFIKLTSSTLNLGGEVPLYLRVNEVKVTEESVCEVNATRFDYTQLAWNVNDNEYIKTPNVYTFPFSAPTNVIFTSQDTEILNSLGKLTWSGTDTSQLDTYIVYYYVPGNLTTDKQIIWTEAGRTTDTSFSVPPLTIASTIFGVRALSKTGKLSNITTTGVILTSPATQADAYSLVLSRDAIILSAESNGTVLPGQLPFEFTATLYKGITPVTTGVTYSINSEATNVQASILNNTVTLQSINGLYGSIVVVATFNGRSLSKTLSVTKARQGLSGAAVNLTTNSQAFTYLADGSSPSPSTARVTANIFNIPSNLVTFEFLVNGLLNQTGTQNYFDYNAPSTYSFTTQQIEVRVKDSNSVVLATDTIAIISVKPGSDAISGFLTNESDVIATDYLGNNGSYGNATGVFRVFDGVIEVTNSGQVAYSVGTSIPGSMVIIGSTNGVYTASLTDADTATVLLNATYKGISLNKSYTISKAKAGAPGTSPLVYSLLTSAPVITKDAIDASTTGEHSPITIYGKQYDGNVTTEYGWITITPKSTNTESAPIDVSVNGYVFTPTPEAAETSYTIKLYSDQNKTTLRDTQVLYVIFNKVTEGIIGDGAGALSFILSNETHNLPANALGVVSSYANSGTDIRIYEGATALQYVDGTAVSPGTWTISSVVKNDISTLGTFSFDTYVATYGNHSGIADNIDSASIVYNIQGVNTLGTGFTGAKSQTFSKSKTGGKGDDGYTPRTVSLSAVNQVFTYTSAGATAAPANTVVTATSFNTDPNANVYYKFFINGSFVEGTNTTSNTFTYTPTELFGSMPQQISVEVREGTNNSAVLATDVLAMIAVKPGTDAITGLLTNESAIVSTDSDGNGGVYTTASGDFFVYDGVNRVTSNIVFSVVTSETVGVDIAINAGTGHYTVSGLTGNNGSAILRAVYKGIVTIEKKYTIAKSKAGVPGIGTSPLIYDIITDTPVITKQAKNAATAGVYSSFTAKGKKYDGNVTSDYGYVTVTSNLEEPAATAQATITTTPAANSGVSNYTIRLYNQANVATATLLDTQVISVVFKGETGDPGSNGASALSAILSNEAHVFPASSDGSIAAASYNGSGTDIRVYYGASEIPYDGVGTANNSWRVASIAVDSINSFDLTTIVDNGLYATVPKHSGMSADYASIEYTITGFSPAGTGFTLKKAQSFSKSKAGTSVTGPTGTSNHRAYKAYALTDTIPSSIANTVSGATPSLWSATPVTVAEGSAQYQIDGVTLTGGNVTTWSAPYLSYFKVGSLEAVSTKTGNLTVTGTIKVGDVTYNAQGAPLNGTLITTNGVEIYNNGVLRVKLGSL